MAYGSARSTVLRRLDTIHHSALRICSGAFRTSPVESLYVICHQLPLQLRRQKISALYFFRAQSVPRHPISQLTLPVSLHRLYSARPSHILPFSHLWKISCVSNVSPFLVEKAITGIVGTVTSTELTRSGDLLVEVSSRKQAQQILKLNSLSTIAISVQPHVTLNTSKGVITCGRLLNLSNEEITQELGGQRVKDVRRIKIRRDGELMPTKHFILTFNTPRLPEYIKAEYVRCSIRSYIPNPLRCFKCQRFGHSKTNCRGTLTCARCAAAGHESTDCTAVEKCVNCDGKHTSFSRSCPKWKVEKEIVATKYKNNISFPEARRLVKAQTPPSGKSYASVVDKNHPVYQTTHHVKDLPAKLKKSSRHNSVALGLADRGIVHKHLPSIFGGVPQVPDLKLHPSDEDEELQMNCDASETPPCVPTSNPPTLS
ncbi:hypothetical protein AVEN_173922-1 [Araneus ventricosus]|uniref:CCHC-type domain-containing protein n=2 Tax=Araneus ventricosus TaxID=182803 RepID=A0A4Y2IAW6_ARAVE|nr:hypothetical protein AVEN_173922-1 [Araneus ventricosus]